MWTFLSMKVSLSQFAPHLATTTWGDFKKKKKKKLWRCFYHRLKSNDIKQANQHILDIHLWEKFYSPPFFLMKIYFLLMRMESFWIFYFSLSHFVCDVFEIFYNRRNIILACFRASKQSQTTTLYWVVDFTSSPSTSSSFYLPSSSSLLAFVCLY